MKTRTIITALMLVLSVVVGGVGAATEWQHSTATYDNMDVLVGVQESTHDYNITVNASKVNVDGPGSGDEIILTSEVNPANITNHSITVPAAVTENQTSGWTYNASADVWYRSYNLTVSKPGDITFVVENGVTFNETSTANNWTVSTASPTNRTALAGVTVGDTTSPNDPGNADAYVSYEIIKHPVQVQETFTSDAQTNVTVSNNTVSVPGATENLTITLTLANISDKPRGIGAAGSYQVAVDQDLAKLGEITMSDAGDNVDVGSVTETDGYNTWTVDVANISADTTLTLTLNVSNVNKTAYNATALKISEVDYTASVVGVTAHDDDDYTVTFGKKAAGGGGQLIAVPGIGVFTDIFGATWGAVVFWFLLGSAVILGGMTIWQLREQKIFSSSTQRGVAYAGILGGISLPFIGGITLGMETLAAALLVIVTAVLAIVNIWLYMRGQTMTVETGGGSGGEALYVR